ncbi:MAG: hypothetical protein ACR2IH_10475 [Pyrinomonadaceae bacterium]
MNATEAMSRSEIIQNSSTRRGVNFRQNADHVRLVILHAFLTPVLFEFRCYRAGLADADGTLMRPPQLIFAAARDNKNGRRVGDLVCQRENLKLISGFLTAKNGIADLARTLGT